MTHEPIVCLYHKQCVDGTTAAAVVLRRYPEARCFPMGFSTAAADVALIREELTPETKIIYVDNAIGLAQIAPLGHTITVIDHHVSESEKIAALAAEYKTISFTYAEVESGASLAWQYFFPEEPLPTLITYVRDIDIFTREYLPESAWLSTYLSEFRDNPSAVLEFFASDLTTPLMLGKTLVSYTEREMEKMCQLEPFFITTPLGDIPAYNITNYQSSAGHILAEKMGSAVILYKISGSEVRCSVRSDTGQVPSALSVAQFLGGGGHECSSGAGVDREYFFSLIKK